VGNAGDSQKERDSPGGGEGTFVSPDKPFQLRNTRTHLNQHFAKLFFRLNVLEGLNNAAIICPTFDYFREIGTQ